MSRRLSLFLLLALTLASLGSLAGKGTQDSDWRRQRALFLQARSLLYQGRRSRFRRLARRLRHYPLYPYLRYWELRRYLSSRSDREIDRFLARYPDTPLAGRLRRAWLRHLARRRAWRRFLHDYRPGLSVALDCAALQARMGHRDRGWQEAALRLWNQGHSQPDACDPVFEGLARDGLLTPERRWQRIARAMASGHLSLAGYLARGLDAADRTWVKRWQQAHRHPARSLRLAIYRHDGPLTRRIVAHALQRLARHDARTAQRLWRRRYARFHWQRAVRDRILRRIALGAALQGLPEAGAWLDRLPAAAHTAQTRAWRVRVALARGNWSAVRAAIAAMPASERGRIQWRYWAARAEIARHPDDEPARWLGELAHRRHYYGFLAADRLHWPYRFHHRPSQYPARTLQRLLQRHPALLRARELFRLDLLAAARREWTLALPRLTPAERAQAAVLAHRWGWHDRAIAAAAAAGRLDDLEIRFPTPHRAIIETLARRQRLDPAWIFGILRQESAFMVDARSDAGALGLMQLTPATGRYSARLLRLARPSRRKLLHAEHNLRLGTAYLRRMLERFDHNAVLATAAYNAGPQPVERWRPRGRPLEAARWVETLPYAETRGYVRSVLAFTTVYRQRLGLPLVRLAARMPPVPPAASP